MAKRKYYPAWQITENLSTTGGELMFANGIEYVGAYHKYTDGVVMSQGSYKEDTSLVLIPFYSRTNDTDLLQYASLTEVDVHKFDDPRPIPIPSLTSTDYEKGWFVRYFIRRSNDTSAPIIEIDQEQFDLLEDDSTGIDFALYSGISLKWKLTGPTNDTLDEFGNIIESGIEDTNRKTLARKEFDFPGISAELGDLNEYADKTLLRSNKIRDSLENGRFAEARNWAPDTGERRLINSHILKKVEHMRSEEHFKERSNDARKVTRETPKRLGK